MKPEYRGGPNAKEKFEEAMRKLFRAPKTITPKKAQVKSDTSQEAKKKSDRG